MSASATITRVGNAGRIGRAEQRRDDLARAQHRAHLPPTGALRARGSRCPARSMTMSWSPALVRKRSATRSPSSSTATLHGTARAQLVERARGRVGAQELHRLGIVRRRRARAGCRWCRRAARAPRASTRGAFVVGLDRGQRQHALDDARRAPVSRTVSGAVPNAATVDRLSTASAAYCHGCGRTRLQPPSRRGAECVCARIGGFAYRQRLSANRAYETSGDSNKDCRRRPSTILHVRLALPAATPSPTRSPTSSPSSSGAPTSSSSRARSRRSSRAERPCASSSASTRPRPTSISGTRWCSTRCARCRTWGTR